MHRKIMKAVERSWAGRLKPAARQAPVGLFPTTEAIEQHVAERGVLAGFSNQVSIDPCELLLQPCEVLVPAAVERVITAENAQHLRCRVLAEGANGPTTPDADAVLDQRRDEVFVIPDILCNAGDVIVSYFEWVQDLQRLFWTEAEVNDRLERILEGAFMQVVCRAAEDGISNQTTTAPAASPRVAR